MFSHAVVPLGAETAAVLELKLWEQVGERDLGPLQAPVAALQDCVHGDQHVVQYCCVHVHLCSEAL